MNKKPLIAILAIVTLSLAGCDNNVDQALNVANGTITEWNMKSVANYMLNYTKQTFSIDSFDGNANNLLFTQQEIELPCSLTPPTSNPVRENYNFSGWYKDTGCEELWDFANDTTTTSLFLYAGWTVTGEGTYIEPDYIAVEHIDDTLSTNLVVTGILGSELSFATAYLTKGGLLRLAQSPEDVAFAIDCVRKTNTVITSATYNSSTDKITVVSQNGEYQESVDVSIVDNSSAYTMPNSTYDAKATSYENGSKDAENHRIMLAGSSSVEFWTNYRADLDPIVAYNHGIGGTTAEDWSNYLLERLVVPYRPKAIVYYVGINNLINTSQDNATIIANVENLMNLTHERLPETHILYVLFNKLPGYFLGYSDRIVEINAALSSFMDGKDWIETIDAGSVLLKETGQADAGYFRLDNLHLSEYGYVLWAAQIRRSLKNWLG